MMHFDISPYQPQDLNLLQVLFLECRKKTFTWRDTSTYRLQQFETETEGEYILVARHRQHIVGFISVWEAENFIHHLYIDEKYQNQQAGTQLLDAVIQKFGLPMRLKCEEKNEPALLFYQKKGFIPTGSGLSSEGAYIVLQLLKN